LESVQDRREAGIEDTTQRKHLNTHGNYDIKSGVLANGPFPAPVLIWNSKPIAKEEI
jgi:hypothetical protein